MADEELSDTLVAYEHGAELDDQADRMDTLEERGQYKAALVNLL